jgi:hypothetical protein
MQVRVATRVNRWLRNIPKLENRMLDAIMLALGLGFFALSIGYTIACDRL